MLTRIIAHEWRVLRADRTMLLVLGVLVALATYAFRNGSAWERSQRETIAQIRAEDSSRLHTMRTQLADIEAGRMEAPAAFQNPAMPAAVGRSLGTRGIVLEPAPLAATAVGQGDLFPSYAIVSTAAGDPYFKTPSIENPLHLLAGRFDLGFVVVFLLPLLVLAIGYSMLSQEREDGTLAMVLTQPVSPATLVAGKLLARFAVLVGALAVVMLIALAFSGFSFTAPNASRDLLLWLLIVSVYTLFWMLVVAIVNVRGRSSAENAMSLATIWLVLTLVVPSALNVTATLLYPVPSRAEMIGVEREAAAEAQQQGATILAAFYQDHPELAPVTAVEGPASFAAQSWAVQEEVERVVTPVRAHYDAQADKQRALLRRFRFLSPALLTQEALLDVAGTGEVRYTGFRNSVAALRAAFREFIGERIVSNQQLSSADALRIPAPDAAFVDNVDETVSTRVGINLLGLLVPSVVLLMLLQRGVLRVRERA
jgi:ABC-2 type transport system permease protein